MVFLGIASLVVSLTVLIGGGYVAVKFRHVIQENIAIVEDFFTPQTEGGTSTFAENLSQLGKLISEEVTAGVNGMLQGSLGGTMKGAAAELEQQAMAENPSLAIMSGMPKAIKKNPFASMIMQQLIERNMPKSGAGLLLGNSQPDNSNGRKHREGIV